MARTDKNNDQTTRLDDATFDSPVGPKSLANADEATLGSRSREKNFGGKTVKRNFEQTLDSSTGQISPSRPAPLAFQPDRFRIERLHAQGGLGEVFVARDLELDRDVALKKIQNRFQSDSAACSRFEFEARVTGGLEHPCIVPVYAFGHHFDGRPYYAMRFIAGDSLKDAIHKHHRARAENPAANHTVEFRTLLMRLIAACNGIAFAHSRGVLHRDIKPANIMLGDYGETLVVDWGLAKFIDSPEDQSADGVVSSSLSSSNPAVTQHGSMVGTPAFMSPEQAAGKLDELTPSSDIFSLGATLFVILTGKVAFEGLALASVITKVKACEFPKPYEVATGVPKPLEAICLKAMAREPTDRYTSALDMATDIEHFLAGEPVTAYREPLNVRCQRWIRKNKTVATAVGVLTVTTAIAATVGMAFVSIEQAKTASALAHVQIEQTKTRAALRAESNARVQTREALGLITDDLVGQMLARNSSLENTDRAILAKILPQFEKFTIETGDAIAAKTLRADGYRRVGNLQRRLGENTAAAKAYHQAQAQFAELAEEYPDQHEFQLDLASISANLALMAADRGQFEKAIEGYTESIHQFTALRESNPANADALIEMVRVLGNRANNQERLAKFELAERDYKQAAELLHNHQPTNRTQDWQQESCRTSSGLATLLSKQEDRWPDAITNYELAVNGYQKLIEVNTDNTQARLEMSAACGNLGWLLVRNGNREPGLQQLEQSVKLAGDLAENFPGFGSYRRQLARSLTLLGKTLAAADRTRSETSLRKAESIWRELAVTRGDDPQISRELADTLGAMASLETASNTESAKGKFKHEILLRKNLQKIDPQNLLWADERIASQINYANFLRQSGKAKTAADQYAEVLDLLDDRAGVDPKWLRAVLFGLGDSCNTAGRWAESLVCWERLTQNKNDPNWTAFEMQRAICLIRTEKTTAGLAVAEQVLAMETNPQPVVVYDVACCYAIACATKKSVAGDDTETNPELARRAVELLKQAASGGFFGEPTMRIHAATDHDLDGLRSTEEFKTFCEEHEIKKSSDF